MEEKSEKKIKTKIKNLKCKKQNKGLDIIVSSVIHDLCNQFTSLGAEIDALIDNCNYNNNKGIIGAIDETREQITSLLHASLGYLRDTSLEDFKEFNVKEQIEKLVKILNFRNNIKIEIEESSGTVIFFSKLDYNSLVLNLLSNSIDAVRAVKRPEIFIRSYINNNNEYTLEVRDNGIGLPKYYNRVFKPFFTTKGDNGSGLGLYNSKRIVNKYNGIIRASRLKSGSLFYFKIPLTFDKK